MFRFGKRSANATRRRGAVAVEAGAVLPVLLILMLGTWEIGRMVQVNQIMVNAAREGARLASAGYVNSVAVTSSQVQQAVRDYMTAAGLPSAAVSGAQVSLVCQATPTWTDPSSALPNDKFQVQLTIPSGAAFNSLRWNLLNQITSLNSMSVTVNWQSINNTQITVNTTLPQ
jgi:Flp pilus assembly protein TadG